MKGHDEEVYNGTAAFFAFLASPEMQLDWHKNTGYVPISLDAYDLAQKEGYYDEFPHQEIAILSLSRSVPTVNTRGMRLGFGVQNTEILNEELENIWAGKKPVEQALNDAVERSNANLRRFERTAGN